MQAAQLIQGENGAMEHTAQSVGDARVALWFALVRGIEEVRLTELMDSCFGDQIDGEMPEIVADMFVMAIQTRDCRGGKGERLIFYKMLLYLYEKFPSTVLQLLGQFQEYGYFKDFFQLGELAADLPQYNLLRSKITDVVANQLIADEAALDAGKGSGGGVSLCAKYAPREGKHFATGKNSVLFSELVNKLYPEAAAQSGARKQNKKQYRQLIAKLTKALDVPEVKMCGKRYGELDFGKVPSVCAKKFYKAYSNEKVKGVLAMAEDVTGNRFPADEDRILCRQNLREATLNQKVKGKQLHPHDIVKTLYEGGNGVSSLEKDVLNVQWQGIRTNLLEQLAASAAAAGAAGEGPAVNVGKLVPLSDVSGSMSGIPMLVSIALGILVSEVNHPAFRDRVLTFESNPSWVSLAEEASIAQKVEKLRNAPWGGSTDISKAFQLICNVVREHRLPVEEVPDMIIFSDMQFNQTCDNTTTQLEQVRKMFHDVGVEVCGSPYPCPKIIFWNLRPDTVGFPAQADDENVQLLSGFSPSLLKYVLEGAPVEMEEKEVVDASTGETVTVKVAKKKPTPYETLRKALDDERYAAVRKLLSDSNEGCLAEYRYETAPEAASAGVAADEEFMPPAPPSS